MKFKTIIEGREIKLKGDVETSTVTISSKQIAKLLNVKHSAVIYHTEREQRFFEVYNLIKTNKGYAYSFESATFIISMFGNKKAQDYAIELYSAITAIEKNLKLKREVN